MTIQFIQLTEPTQVILQAINKWENDSELISLTRPNRNEEDQYSRERITLEYMNARLKHEHIYLLYLNDTLVGEMNYMVDPSHLFKKEPGTAWIGITIGEPAGRGKGFGSKAMQFLEEEIKRQGIRRIELGVFAFNKHAHKLYQKLGYKEIGRIDDFTFWEGRMWADIRMEKYL